MIGRQHMVEIPQVILAELSRRITLILKQRCNCHELIGHTDRRARKTDFGQPRLINALPRNEG